MPNAKTTDLPDGVRKHLPLHAQEVFRKAYKVARAAVKHEYAKHERAEEWSPAPRMDHAHDGR